MSTVPDQIDARRRTMLPPGSLGLLALLLVMAGVVAVLVSLTGNTLALYAMGGVMAVILAALVVMRPEYGVFLLVFVVFTNLSSIFTDSGLPSINKPLVALVAVSLLVNYALRRDEPLRFSSTQLLMAAYGVVLLLSALQATDRARAQDLGFEFLKDFIIMLCVVYALSSSRHLKAAGWLVLAAVGILTLLGAYQVLTGNYQQTFMGLAVSLREEVVTALSRPRLTGPLGDPNFYGQVLVAVLPLGIYRVLDERRLWVKAVAGVISLLLVFSILNTYSRGAFLAMILVLLVIALERRASIVFYGAAALAAILMLLALPAGYTERIQSLFELNPTDQTSLYADDSFRGRASEILAGLNMFADHPVLGVGAGNYNLNYQEYAGRLGLERRTEARDAHSLYVEAAAETGLLGLLAFIAIFVSLFGGLLKTRRRLRLLGDGDRMLTWVTSLSVGLLGYLTTSIFLHADFARYLWMLVALAIAAIEIVHRQGSVDSRVAPEAVEAAAS